MILSSCDDPIVSLKNTKNSFSNPDIVGILPDGRTVSCVVRYIPNSHKHYIYFTGSDVTVNTTLSHGKTTSNQTIVLIDGIEYIPLEKEDK